MVKTAIRSSTSSRSPLRLTGPGSNRRFSFVNETQKAILLGDVSFDGFDNQPRIEINVLLEHQSATERDPNLHNGTISGALEHLAGL